jgi:hypothetical protein
MVALIETILPTVAALWTMAETTPMSWTIGTTSRERVTDSTSPPPAAKIVMLNWLSGVSSLVAIVIVDVKEGLAEAGANRIVVPAGTP